MLREGLIQKKTIKRTKQGDKPQQIKERLRAKSLQSRD